MERIRISYAKMEALRYTSNLDIHKIWERLLRRARLPLAYSQGFHPQPRINQAAPLPLGILSQVEMVDVWLEEDIPPEQVKEALVKAAPPGMEIDNISAVDPKAPALPTIVRSSEYLAILLDPVDPGMVQSKLDGFMASEAAVRERRGKSYDLRPLVEELGMEPEKDGMARIRMRLSAREAATGRPDEVLLALGFDPTSARIERTRLILDL
jgi:radical SAM-linked protein